MCRRPPLEFGIQTTWLARRSRRDGQNKFSAGRIVCTHEKVLWLTSRAAHRTQCSDIPPGTKGRVREFRLVSSVGTGRWGRVLMCVGHGAGLQILLCKVLMCRGRFVGNGAERSEMATSLKCRAVHLQGAAEAAPALPVPRERGARPYVGGVGVAQLSGRRRLSR